MIFANPAHIPDLLKLASKMPQVKAIISLDSWSSIQAKNSRPGIQTAAAMTQWGDSVGIKVLDIVELEALGEQHKTPHRPPTPDMNINFCYTSGTTGNPKGAILLHRNIAGVVISTQHGHSIEADSVLLSYLPLSHVYEFFVEVIALTTGAAIAYHCGDNLRLLEDMQIVKPTVRPGCHIPLGLRFADAQSFAPVVHCLGPACSEPDLPGDQSADSRRSGTQGRHRPESLCGQARQLARNRTGHARLVGPHPVQQDCAAHGRSYPDDGHRVGADQPGRPRLFARCVLVRCRRGVRSDW